MSSAPRFVPRWRRAERNRLHSPSFRGGAQHRTRNLEIPGSRFACPGMTSINSTPLLARHQRTEELPALAFEALHLQLLERRKIGRAGLDLGARQIDANFEIEVGRLAHHV